MKEKTGVLIGMLEDDKKIEFNRFENGNEIGTSIIIGTPEAGKEIKLIDRIKMIEYNETLDTIKTTLELLDMLLDKNNINEVIKVILNEDLYSDLYKNNINVEDYYDKKNLIKEIINFSLGDVEGKAFRRKISMTILTMCLNKNNIGEIIKIISKGDTK